MRLRFRTRNYNPFHSPLPSLSICLTIPLNQRKLMKIFYRHDELIIKTPLHGDDKFGLSCNKSIIFSAIESIVFTKGFSN